MYYMYWYVPYILNTSWSGEEDEEEEEGEGFKYLLYIAGLVARGKFVHAAISRHGAEYVKLHVTCFICSFSLVAPDFAALAFDGWALAVKTVALTIVAIHQILLPNVLRALSRSSGAKFR